MAQLSLCVFHLGGSIWREHQALEAQLGHTDSRLTLLVYTQPMLEANRQRFVPFCSQNRSSAHTGRNGNPVMDEDLKWRAQGDDLRTFLGDFVASLPQVEFPAGLSL
jgi:hypothetical protein